jgi:hypothetical protein
MPLIAPSIKEKFKTRILQGLQREYAGQNVPKDVMDSWAKIANAVSDIAIDLVVELTTNAQVVPGIPMVGTCAVGPVAGSTVAPGKIL